MATFRATVGNVHAQKVSGVHGNGQPVLHGRSLNGLTELTTSGTAGLVQSGGSDFEASQGDFVTMVCTGAVWVAIAASPTAAVGTELFLKADERWTGSLEEGDKISVIDDS